AAEVTEKVRVLFEHGDPDARASEEKPEHHACRTAAGDDAVHGQTSIGNVPCRSERPVPPAEALAKAIPQRELSDVGDGQPSRAEPEGEPRIPTEPRRLVVVPGAAVVEKRRQSYAEQPPHLVLHDHTVFEREPLHPSACEGVGAEQTGTLTVRPQV